MFENKMEVKHKERLGRVREGAVRVLNRVVSSTKEGIEHEADQRHAEIIVRDAVLREHRRSHHAWSQRRRRSS